MNLKEIRKQLDKLDNELIKILAKRTSLIPEVAKYKKENNIPRYQPEREKEIINKKIKLAKKYKINSELIEKIFKLIIKDSHRIQKEILKK